METTVSNVPLNATQRFVLQTFATVLFPLQRLRSCMNFKQKH